MANNQNSLMKKIPAKSLFTQIFTSFVNKNPNNNVGDVSNFIFYKIVDSVREDEFLLQCINTKATFQADITEIVFDIDILYGLHPIQACFIGIEYAKYLKKTNTPLSIRNDQKAKLCKYPACRYGLYRICYQDRRGNINFINQKSDEEFLMEPRDIALSKELIQEFDAAQAFYIGIVAGLKLNNPTKQHDETLKNFKRPYLRLVK